jgi:hypothetical protein
MRPWVYVCGDSRSAPTAATAPHPRDAGAGGFLGACSLFHLHSSAVCTCSWGCSALETSASSATAAASTVLSSHSISHFGEHAHLCALASTWEGCALCSDCNRAPTYHVQVARVVSGRRMLSVAYNSSGPVRRINTHPFLFQCVTLRAEDMTMQCPYSPCHNIRPTNASGGRGGGVGGPGLFSHPLPLHAVIADTNTMVLTHTHNTQLHCFQSSFGRCARRLPGGGQREGGGGCLAGHPAEGL